MSVNEPMSQYNEWYKNAKRVRTVLKGESAIKQAAGEFLPLLSGVDMIGNNAYRERASFFAATARTRSALLGSLFQKPVTFNLSNVPELEYLKKSATLDGMGFDILVQMVAEEVISVGRAGLLVDMNDIDGRPYIAHYTGESIIKWRSKLINGQNKLVLVVLQETYEQVDPSNKFKSEFKTRFRVLSLEGDDNNPVYTVSIYLAENNIKDQFFEADRIEPKFKGESLDYIPFVFVNTSNTGNEPQDSILLDIANINISHYRNSADLEHALHFTALPTPYVCAGNVNGNTSEIKFDENGNAVPVENSSQELQLGSTTAWMLGIDAKVGMLEFTGAGVASIREEMKDKEARIAALGARMMISDQSTASTAYAERVRNTAEHNSLASLARSLEDGFSQCLEFAAKWLGYNEATEASIQLNKDYNATPIQAAELRQMFELYLADGIDVQTLIFNMQRGNVTRDDWNPEEHIKILELAKQASKKQKEQEARNQI